jgi:hypothetical protein
MNMTTLHFNKNKSKYVILLITKEIDTQNANETLQKIANLIG